MSSKLREMPVDELKEYFKYELKFGMEKIKRLSAEWETGENIYQAVISAPAHAGLDAPTALSTYLRRDTEVDQRPLFNTVLVARAQQFLHSKLCITEPSVVTSPMNRDYDTKKRAEFAQPVLSSVQRTSCLQDKLEGGCYIDIVTKGSACIYVGWDPNAGEVVDFDRETGEITMSGDFCIRSVNMQDFFPQSSADNIHEMDSCIERIWVDVRKAVHEYPEIKPYIDQLIERDNQSAKTNNNSERSSNSIALYHYWEKGQSWNGMLGKHVVFIVKQKFENHRRDIDLDQIEILYHGENPLEHKDVPYSWFTDLDIRNDIYGMSRSTHCAHHIDTANAFMSATIEAIELHGLPRLVAPENSTDKSITENDIAKVLYYNATSGGQVYHLKPTPVTNDIWRMMEIIEREVDMMYGQNEFSKGQVNRELSSYTVQIGVEMDDKYRIRLFNKKTQFLERIYKQILALAIQFVKTPRKIKMVGKRNMYKELYWSGQDLKDVDVNVEYGKYLPIDPAAKKQMILEIINSGAYERAGGNPAKLFKIIVDGDMLDLADIFEASKEIQDSEIAAMLVGEEVRVQPWHEHTAHMDKLQEFMQTADFELLGKEKKALVWEHYTKHENEFAKIQAKAQSVKDPNAAMQGVPNQNMPGSPQEGIVPPEPTAQGV